MTSTTSSQWADGTQFTVRCDRAYALFLMARYQSKLFISWQDGFMTVCRVGRTADLIAVCAE